MGNNPTPKINFNALRSPDPRQVTGIATLQQLLDKMRVHSARYPWLDFTVPAPPLPTPRGRHECDIALYWDQTGLRNCDGFMGWGELEEGSFIVWPGSYSTEVVRSIFGGEHCICHRLTESASVKEFAPAHPLFDRQLSLNSLEKAVAAGHGPNLIYFQASRDATPVPVTLTLDMVWRRHSKYDPDRLRITLPEEAVRDLAMA